jgi:hypothetical protein
MFWGVGEPGKGPEEQGGSWAYAILPFMDQQNVYQLRAWTTGLQPYICPSRRTSAPLPAVNDRFGQYDGGGWVWGRIDYAANSLLIRPRVNYPYSFAFITDGTVTVHGSEALVFKGFVSVDERFGAQNGPRLCRNPLISCCSTRERLRWYLSDNSYWRKGTRPQYLPYG